MNRRAFLGGASAATFGVLCQGRRGWAYDVKPNEVIQVACIGVGGKGDGDSTHAGHFGKVVAICDVDDRRMEAKAREYPDAKKFYDFRELFDQLGDKVDAVVVSTADHAHAPASLRAMRMGKHVYCQKPLTHTVHEARLMRETARKYKVCTQMGNQGAASPGQRRGAELLLTGAIGEVAEVHCWTDRPREFWKQAPAITARPSGTFEIPKHLHWEQFLGAAPERPYAPVYTPMLWRGWWDFGTGCLGDMGCHTTSLPFHGLKLGLPTKVSAQSGEINPETYPAWATVTYEFPARDGLPPVKLTWYEGAKDGKRNLPPEELFQDGAKAAACGALFLGTKGVMYCPDSSCTKQILWPSEKFREFKDPEQILPRIKDATSDGDDNHKREWFQAIREGKPEVAYMNFDFASVQTEALLLGNIAMRTGETLAYDSAAGRITSSTAADALLTKPYRKGWEI